MAYQHEAFAFNMEQPPQSNMYFAQPMHFPPFMQQCPQPELMYNPYAYSDFPEFLAAGMMPEDFDDGAEITTRPRLTKEQVEILESQFQAHPKPNSMVKKQLAMQTKLSLNRVANWFQNRRAKAKQQRKQEEFENSQAAQNVDWKSENNNDEDKDEDEEHDSPVTAAFPPSSATSDSAKSGTDSMPPKSPIKVRNSSHDATWASLQLSLGQDKLVQQQAMIQQQQAQKDAMLVMPPPEIPPQLQTASLPLRSPHPIQATAFDWSNREAMFDSWTSSPIAAANDIPFDFGFHTDYSSSHHESASDASPELPQQNFIVTSGSWDSSLNTPTQAVHQQSQGDFGSLLQSPTLPLPSYPESRRGSAGESLAANFESFALVSEPPKQMPQMPPSVPLRRPEAEIDIAARRKRPRPAALTSASLRSRSYGALTSVSPTLRPGLTPPSAHTIRHVKSQGHGLNSHYAGIRKASAAQKSPLNVATFAEAESFKRLMAQKATEAAANSNQNTPTSAQYSIPSSNADYISHIPNMKDVDMGSQMREILTEYQKLQSPPITPFQQEFMLQTTQSGVSLSTGPQYATLNDYTPPYSAGPLTNSSWSDAPLTSPDISTAFLPVSYVPSLTYTSQADDLSAVRSSWLLPSDHSPDASVSSAGDKKTEFFIQEFPNQKEEHAHVAQQLAQQRPKHYVFANSKPSDYSE